MKMPEMPDLDFNLITEENIKEAALNLKQNEKIPEAEKKMLLSYLDFYLWFLVLLKKGKLNVLHLFRIFGKKAISGNKDQ